MSVCKKLKNSRQQAVDKCLEEAGELKMKNGGEKLVAMAEYQKQGSGITISLILAVISLSLATMATKAAVISVYIADESRPPESLLSEVDGSATVGMLAVVIFIIFTVLHTWSTRASRAAAEVCRYRGSYIQATPGMEPTRQ